MVATTTTSPSLEKQIEAASSTRPAFDRILVQLDDRPELTPGGIALPEGSDSDEHSRARVLAVGPGPLLQSGGYGPMPCKVGDLVILVHPYSRYQHTIKLKDSSCAVIVAVKEVLCVIEE